MQSTKRLSINLCIIIILISSIGQVTSDLYLASLPAMGKYFNVDSHWVQFSITVFMLGFCFSQLVYGPWSDAVGRRIPLISGLLLNFIGGFIATLSTHIYLLLLGRFLQGIGVGAANSLARPILRDLFEKEKLAIYNSYLAISGVFILTTAPILGGYIQQYWGWRYNFLILTLYGLFTLLSFYFKVSETSQHHHKDNFKVSVIWSNAKELYRKSLFWKYTLCPLFTYAGILVWVTATPILLQEKLGLSPSQFGWIYISAGLGFLMGAFLNTKWVRYCGIDYMIQLGFLGQFIAGLVMLVFYLLNFANVWVIVIPIFLFMTGASLVFPNASAGALTPFPKLAGTAGALFGFTQTFGGILSSGSIAILPEENQLPMAFAFIIIALLSFMVFYTFQSDENF